LQQVRDFLVGIAVMRAARLRPLAEQRVGLVEEQDSTPGVVHGVTDDFSYNVVEGGVHVHDFHATLVRPLLA
jgi:hypothetical protein